MHILWDTLKAGKNVYIHDGAFHFTINWMSPWTIKTVKSHIVNSFTE